jgi:hypothetical protein
MATEQIQDMFVYTSIEVLIGFNRGDINGKAGADQSGSSVSLSSDGTHVRLVHQIMMGPDKIMFMSLYQYRDLDWVQRGT